MNKEKVIIIGTSGHAKVIIDIFEKQANVEIIGLIDTKRAIGEETLGYTIIGADQDLPEIMKNVPNAKLFIAIGDNWLRYKVFQNIISMIPQVSFATAIHPSVQFGKDVSIGEGTAFMAGAIINPSTQIGKFVIVNTKAAIEHDNIIGDFACVLPNATTGGNVTVGDFSAIGISASIKHGVTIGKHCVIGGGALLLNDCSDNLLLYGVPAKPMKKREEGEKYL
jgi:sugar O-acyltransferase (sialic acid O-acetyltransferase NeuD family)